MKTLKKESKGNEHTKNDFKKSLRKPKNIGNKNKDTRRK